MPVKLLFLLFFLWQYNSFLSPTRITQPRTGLPAQRGVRVLLWPAEEKRQSAEWPIAANWDAQGKLALACSHSFHIYFTESVCASFVKLFVLAVSDVEVKRHKLICKLAMFLRSSLRVSYLVPSHSVSCPKPSCYASHEGSISVHSVMPFEHFCSYLSCLFGSQQLASEYPWGSPGRRWYK